MPIITEKILAPEVQQEVVYVSPLIYNILPSEQGRSKVQLPIHKVTLNNKEHIDL